MSNNLESLRASFTAHYESPTDTKTFHYTLPALAQECSESQAKTAHLSELRTSSKKLQEDINRFLTEKMEEDKKNAGKSGQNSGGQKSKDELEEENYGEENGEDGT